MYFILQKEPWYSLGILVMRIWNSNLTVYKRDGVCNRLITSRKAEAAGRDVRLVIEIINAEAVGRGMYMQLQPQSIS